MKESHLDSCPETRPPWSRHGGVVVWDGVLCFVVLVNLPVSCSVLDDDLSFAGNAQDLVHDAGCSLHRGAIGHSHDLTCRRCLTTSKTTDLECPASFGACSAGRRQQQQQPQIASRPTETSMTNRTQTNPAPSRDARSRAEVGSIPMMSAGVPRTVSCITTLGVAAFPLPNTTCRTRTAHHHVNLSQILSADSSRTGRVSRPRAHEGVMTTDGTRSLRLES